jgi:adenylate kinase
VAVLLEVPREVLAERLAARAVAERRADDDVIAHRLQVYEQESAPLVEYYAPLLRRVDADGSVTTVAERVLAAVLSAA